MTAMTGGKGVVRTFAAFGESGNSAVPPQALKLSRPSGDEFVGIRLVPHVPDHLVLGGVKDIVDGDGQFHRPEAGSQVAAGTGYDIDNDVAYFICKFG